MCGKSSMYTEAFKHNSPVFFIDCLGEKSLKLCFEKTYLSYIYLFAGHPTQGQVNYNEAQLKLKQ